MNFGEPQRSTKAIPFRTTVELFDGTSQIIDHENGTWQIIDHENGTCDILFIAIRNWRPLKIEGSSGSCSFPTKFGLMFVGSIFLLRLIFLLGLETCGGDVQHWAGRVSNWFLCQIFFLGDMIKMGLWLRFWYFFFCRRSAATGGILCIVFLNTEAIRFSVSESFYRCFLGFWMTMTFRRSCQWRF